MKQSILLFALPFFTFLSPIEAKEESAQIEKRSASEIGKLDPEMAERKQADDDLSWHDVTSWGVEGRILPDAERKRWFDRLPGAAEGTVTEAVWSLSRHSAGMMVRFKTDATAIHVHYKLLNANLAMAHMPATGVSGVDLYARDDHRRMAMGSSNPTLVTGGQSCSLSAGWLRALREYAAYLPLYNGVDFLNIGVPPTSKFESMVPRQKPPRFLRHKHHSRCLCKSSRHGAYGDSGTPLRHAGRESRLLW